MTDEDDARNAARNELIRACRHVPVTADGRGVWCRACGARFAVVLEPRRLGPLSFPDDAEVAG